MIRPLASLAALLAFAAPVLADGTPPFVSLTACRIDAQTVRLDYAFEGGACQQVGEIEASEPRGTIAAVIIPTSDTSEVCTMQIVTIEGGATLELAEPMADLDVTALYPDNREQAHGTVEINDGDPDCTAPAAQ